MGTLLAAIEAPRHNTAGEPLPEEDALLDASWGGDDRVLAIGCHSGAPSPPAGAWGHVASRGCVGSRASSRGLIPINVETGRSSLFEARSHLTLTALP